MMAPRYRQIQRGPRQFMRLGISIWLATVVMPNITVAASVAEQFETARHGILHVGTYQAQPADLNSPRPIKWLGTAFAVDQTCTFVTAKHVLKDADRKELVVRFQLPNDLGKVRTVRTRVLSEDATRDLAFLKIDQYEGKPCVSGTLHVFPIYPGELARIAGQSVMIIGYPVIAEVDLDLPIVRTGIVASAEVEWPDGRMLLLDLLGVPGFSGSPVVLIETGQVIGIVFGPGPTQRAFGFEWATPLSLSDYEKATKAPDSTTEGGSPK